MNLTLVHEYLIQLVSNACLPAPLQGCNFELNDEMIAKDEDWEALQDIINNAKLSEGYLTLAPDIEVMEAKSPEDIYKVLNFSYQVIDLTLDTYFMIFCCHYVLYYHRTLQIFTAFNVL